MLRGKKGKERKKMGGWGGGGGGKVKKEEKKGTSLCTLATGSCTLSLSDIALVKQPGDSHCHWVQHALF